jgi:hypothetical protein
VIDPDDILPGTRVRVHLPTRKRPNRLPTFATGTIRMYQDGDFIESSSKSANGGIISHRPNRRLVDSLGFYWVELDRIPGDSPDGPLRVIARCEEMSALA